MFEEEEGLSRDLTGRSLERWSNKCGRVARSGSSGRAARSGSSGDLSSGESKFLHKRNPKEDREWMWRQIMRLSSLFIGHRGERGDGTMEEKRLTMSKVIQCFYFGEKRGRGSAYFERGKEHVSGSWFLHGGATGGCSGTAVRVGRRLNWPEVDDNQSGQLDGKVVCAKYYCVDQTCCQNRVGWIREILDRNKIVKKNLGYYSLNKKQSFELKTEEIGSNQVLDFF
jgi:hypothetical protein